MDSSNSVEDLEIDLLLEGVFRRFGQDFRGYRRESVRQRLHLLMRQLGAETVSALQNFVLHDSKAGATLLRSLGMKHAALFDDPEYFSALRDTMVPWLRSFPSPKIWVAECGSTEDVCALSILLAEEGLHEKTQIFATTANDVVLDDARKGVFPLDRWPEYARNYHKVGGKADLGDYCHEENGKAVFNPELRANVTWAQYSLTSDASFNEFQVIVCRRTLAEFGAALERRTLQLFYESMPLFGILSVDRDKGLKSAPFISRYKPIDEEQGLYRRVA